MIAIYKGGELFAISENPRWVCMQANGCYGLCAETEATGIVVGGAVYNLPGEGVGSAETVAYTKADGGTYIFAQQARLAATEDAACALDIEYDARIGAIEDVLCEMDTANT